MKHEKHHKLTWKMKNMESWRNERHTLRALLSSNFFVSCGLVFRAFTIRHNEGGTRKSLSCYRVCGIVSSGFYNKEEVGSLQRAEQETVSLHNLANAMENMNRTRIDATGNRLRLMDGERLYPKNWSGSTSLAGFGRELAAWLGYVDRKHEVGK